MEKMLIGSLELNKTKNGRPVIELYSTNTALQFPELRLFDLSALLAIGLDPDSLASAQRVHRRFWAYFTTSEKTNGQGNPYRDVHHLEPLDAPATTTSTDTTELLTELRNMAGTLARIAAHLDIPLHDPDPIPDGPIWQRYRYRNGIACSDNEAEREAFDLYVQETGTRPADVDALRDWYQSRPRS